MRRCGQAAVLRPWGLRPAIRKKTLPVEVEVVRNRHPFHHGRVYAKREKPLIGRIAALLAALVGIKCFSADRVSLIPREFLVQLKSLFWAFGVIIKAVIAVCWDLLGFLGRLLVKR